MNKQNLEKALGGFRGLKIGLFLKDAQFIEGNLLDIKPDHLIVEVSQNVFYFALNQIHAISKNAKDFRISLDSTAHLSRSNLHELLKELKYNWVTINSLSRQTFFGMLSKIADDHILLINNEEQLYIQKAFITNIYKGEYQLSEDNQTVDSQDGISKEIETPEDSESNGSNLPSSLKIYDFSNEGDVSLEADVGDVSANSEALSTEEMSVPSADLLEESTPEPEQDEFTEQQVGVETNTNDVVHSIQEMETQLRKLLNEVITSNKSSAENDEPIEQTQVETNKGSLEISEQPTDIQEERINEYTDNSLDSQIILENASIVDHRHPVYEDKEDEELSLIEEKMDVQKSASTEAEKGNSHYSAVENVLVSFPLVSKVGNIGIPTLSPFNNHELFEETRESSSTVSSGDMERLHHEDFEEADFVLSEPRYSPSFKRKLEDSVHAAPDTNRDQTTVQSDLEESSSYQDNEFDRFQPVYDEMFEHHFNRIREKSVKIVDKTLIKKAVDNDQPPDLIVQANNEETLESQYYALMKQAERMYLQVRANRRNE
ncbi:DUF2642 domain-containing protein [Sporosarcina sp. Te-1]|uniref:DUF2642 domain-containing protein n=1 Tax=Sporosarcina sp. Te-1 TaxID=2818390 RepID=UPI001A9D5982|nr:DUF2642 domain-containing protein [Sporosarcina sp. Te-1]QTD42957.1 DUF2642 domain-containing protein [Sporosarcina sp. Te-1]